MFDSETGENEFTLVLVLEGKSKRNGNRNERSYLTGPKIDQKWFLRSGVPIAGSPERKVEEKSNKIVIYFIYTSSFPNVLARAAGSLDGFGFSP